jgi:hypothetical protein
MRARITAISRLAVGERKWAWNVGKFVLLLNCTDRRVDKHCKLYIVRADPFLMVKLRCDGVRRLRKTYTACLFGLAFDFIASQLGRQQNMRSVRPAAATECNTVIQDTWVDRAFDLRVPQSIACR